MSAITTRAHISDVRKTEFEDVIILYTYIWYNLLEYVTCKITYH